MRLFIFIFIQFTFFTVWSAPTCRQLFDVKIKSTLAEPMASLRVAAVQFPLGEKQTAQSFLNKVQIFIKEAHDNGAQVVVFPELITTELVDWDKNTDAEQLQAIALNFTPLYIEWLKVQAQSYKISVLGGTSPRAVDGQIFNTAILALADGTTVLQDKVFLTPDEKKWNWEAGTEFKTFNTPWGKTAITTCFDCEFPIVSKMLSKAQPEVILVPSWTSTESGLNRVDWTAKSRAIEHYAFVVKTGTVADPTSTQIHFGKASIITPQDVGFPTAPIEGNLNEASIIYSNLDLNLLRQRRKETGYFPDKEQKIRKSALKLIMD